MIQLRELTTRKTELHFNAEKRSFSLKIEGVLVAEMPLNEHTTLLLPMYMNAVQMYAALEKCIDVHFDVTLRNELLQLMNKINTSIKSCELLRANLGSDRKTEKNEPSL